MEQRLEIVEIRAFDERAVEFRRPFVQLGGYVGQRFDLTLQEVAVEQLAARRVQFVFGQQADDFINRSRVGQLRQPRVLRRVRPHPVELREDEFVAGVDDWLLHDVSTKKRPASGRTAC